MKVSASPQLSLFQRTGNSIYLLQTCLFLLVSNLLLANTVLGPDCISAEVICSNETINFTPLGSGADDFSNPNNGLGCLTSGENQTAWYYFEINDQAPAGLELGFTLTPAGGAGEDYDFAVYGANVECNNLGDPIRCSWAANDCVFCPSTGLGQGATDTSEDSNGDGFVAALTVQPGEGYYLLVDNWLGSSNGFTMEWTGPAADYLNCCTLSVPEGSDQEFCQQNTPLTVDLVGSFTGSSNISSVNWEGSFINDPNALQTTVNIPANFTGTLTYTLTVGESGCSDQTTYTITIHPEPIVSLQVTDPSCGGDGAIGLTATGLNQPYTYVWSDGSTTPELEDLTGGIFEATITDNNGCELVIPVDLPEVQTITAMVDAVEPESCFGAEDGSATLNITNGTPPYNVVWDNNTTGLVLQQVPGGLYTASITDANGCTIEQLVSIDGPEPIGFSYDLADVSCHGEQDGSIVLNEVIGGTSPFQYQVNDGLFQPFSGSGIVSNLPAGMYTVVVRDANDCLTEEVLTITEPPLLDVEIVADSLVRLGDETTLDVLTTADIQDFQWAGLGDSLTSVLSPEIVPLETRQYAITVTDAFGCTATDVITIFVEKNREVYFPNAFSPNGDGINDEFIGYAGSNVEEIIEMKVFNRWGNLLFTAENFLTGDTKRGWDGSERGKPSAPGVYTYFATVRFIDGAIVTLGGDLVLLR